MLALNYCKSIYCERILLSNYNQSKEATTWKRLQNTFTRSCTEKYRKQSYYDSFWIRAWSPIKLLKLLLKLMALFWVAELEKVKKAEQNAAQQALLTNESLVSLRGDKMSPSYFLWKNEDIHYSNFYSYGCTYECVFCNQRKITGLSQPGNAWESQIILSEHLKVILVFLAKWKLPIMEKFYCIALGNRKLLRPLIKPLKINQGIRPLYRHRCINRTHGRKAKKLWVDHWLRSVYG